MAIIALYMQHGRFMKLSAAGNILMISNQVVEINLRCHTDRKQHQQETRYEFLYSAPLFQFAGKVNTLTGGHKK